MTVAMTLGGVDLGPNFPIYSRAFEYIRPDDQGPSIRKVNISIAGFLEADNHGEIMALYETIKNIVDTNDTTFTYTADGTTIYNNKAVVIDGYTEPEDAEYAKLVLGDYGIQFHYYENNTDTIPISCTYTPSSGPAYTFEKVPKWSRSIKPERESYRSPLRGSVVTIALSGMLYADTHTSLMTKIEALQTAFSKDGTLTYGLFTNTIMRVNHCDIQPVVPMNFAYFDIELAYDIGTNTTLKRSMRINRIHHNPVVTEEPGCGRRVVELMNRSSQEINYSISIQANSLTECRELLSTEAAFMIEPGGIEMPGGTENWDLDNFRVELSVTKLYTTPIIGNLPGTGE